MRRALATILLALSWASTALAEGPCIEDGRPVVAVRLSELGAPVADEIADHLRRSLDKRSISVCARDGARGVAVLEIVPGAEAFVLTLHIVDGVTNKRVSRDLDARSIPPEGRPLAIAQAGDELLRASWAELFVEGSAKQARDAPPEVVKAAAPQETAQSRPSEPAMRIALGVGLGAEVFTSGHRQLGVDLAAGWNPWPRIGAFARVGIRSTESRDSSFGSHETGATKGSLGLAVRSFLAPKGWVDVGPHLEVMRFSFSPSATPGFVAREADAVAVYASMEGRLWLLPSAPVALGAALSAGIPLRSARAVGPNGPVHEIGGLLIGTALIVGLSW